MEDFICLIAKLIMVSCFVIAGLLSLPILIVCYPLSLIAAGISYLWEFLEKEIHEKHKPCTQV